MLGFTLAYESNRDKNKCKMYCNLANFHVRVVYTKYIYSTFCQFQSHDQQSSGGVTCDDETDIRATADRER